MIREFQTYAGLGLALAKWARQAPEADPHGLVRRTLERRAENFLELMKHAVFSRPANPYHTLFQWAGCTYADLDEMVRRQGLEPALEALYRAGIYLSHDEFKGKAPVVRGARQLWVNAGSLANPRFKGVVETSSSGSRSRGTITRRSLEYQHYREAQEQVMTADYESEGRALVMMGEILPATGGLRRVLNCGRRGRPPEKWFSFAGAVSDARPYRAVTHLMLAELRLLGVPVVFPEYLPHNDFTPVARWIAARRQEGRACLVLGGVSRGVRVAAAAQEHGLDIRGTLFLLGGEALTDAKLAVIEAAGCEAHARYTISELGPVGVGCRRMQGNCVHTCLDSVAVISRRKVAPLSDVEVNSLLFTSLLPSAATVVVNVEMDDAGIVGPARCGCPLSRMGFTQQIDRIFSYGKLTGWGTTLLGDDLLEILERRLPARFGGVPSDYQLVEREGTAQTEIELRINPRLRLASEEEVKRFFLAQVRGLWGGSLTQRLWVHSGAVRVVFAEPYSGLRGKVHALHLLGMARDERERRKTFPDGA